MAGAGVKADMPEVEVEIEFEVEFEVEFEPSSIFRFMHKLALLQLPEISSVSYSRVFKASSVFGVTRDKWLLS